LFDVGGIIGGIIAGVISDYSGMSATTCAGMLSVAIPMVSHIQGLKLKYLWCCRNVHQYLLYLIEYFVSSYLYTKAMAHTVCGPIFVC